MLRHLLYPFLPYRSLFLPFLLASAVAVPVWVILRLYVLRTRRIALSVRREFLLLTFVIYLAGLATATLGANRPSRSVGESMVGVELRPNPASLTCSSALMPEGSREQGFCVRNARGNVVLFIPLGILLPLIWRRLRFWQVIRIALAVSCGIELVQYFSRAWGSYRSADVNDVLLNVFGAFLGLGLVTLLRLREARRPAVQRV